MNQEVKAKWIAALRSGKYQQGKFKLKLDNDTYCCLGVLCDIHKNEFDNKWDNGYYLNSLRVLPNEVISYAGLDDDGGKFTIEEGETQHLFRLNDNENKSFEEIADIIEKHF